MKSAEIPVNKHITNFLAKLVVVGLISIIVLPNFSALNTNQSLITALVLSIIAYALGDLFVLPAYGNITATIGDIILAAVVFYAADLMVNGAITLSAAGWLLALGGIALGEWFLHRYLKLSPVPEETVKDDLK